MQFEQPSFEYSTPFAYHGGYAYTSPPPQSGMPPRPQTYYEAGYPTPAPSPRTPSSSSRRRSEMNSSGEYRRPSSSRRSHEHAEFSSHDQYRATSPRPAGSHRAPPFVHTPLHTPPPSSHAHHGPMPNIYAHAVPGFTQAYPDYFSFSPAPGTQSPPHDRSRSRTHHRTQTWSGEQSPRSPHKSSKPSRTSTEPPKPTIDEEEKRQKAREHHIPADYSLKNWDAGEAPIILLGSVFDANSLGEWIFNWTKYHHGRTHDATKTAGALWELLIELSSKLKRAKLFRDDIKSPENREIIDEFVESGERLWKKLKSLLKSCEEYMWTGAKRVTSPNPAEGKTKVQMGKKSGAEFVDAMFNDSKEWEKTERLIRGMATWCSRYSVNIDNDLLAHFK